MVAGPDGSGWRTEASPEADVASLTRPWAPGDRLRLELDQAPRLTFPDRRVDALRGCVAVEHGPLVYCVEQVDLPDGADLADVADQRGCPPHARRSPGTGGGTRRSACRVSSARATRPGGPTGARRGQGRAAGGAHHRPVPPLGEPRRGCDARLAAGRRSLRLLAGPSGSGAPTCSTSPGSCGLRTHTYAVKRMTVIACRCRHTDGDPGPSPPTDQGAIT